METLLDLTFNNPIFITISILIIWFAPGILIRRMAERKYLEKKERIQKEKIAKLYPNSKN